MTTPFFNIQCWFLGSVSRVFNVTSKVRRHDGISSNDIFSWQGIHIMWMCRRMNHSIFYLVKSHYWFIHVVVHDTIKLSNEHVRSHGCLDYFSIKFSELWIISYFWVRHQLLPSDFISSFWLIINRKYDCTIHRNAFDDSDSHVSEWTPSK